MSSQQEFVFELLDNAKFNYPNYLNGKPCSLIQIDMRDSCAGLGNISDSDLQQYIQQWKDKEDGKTKS
jgi:hypothetical protein